MVGSVRSHVFALTGGIGSGKSTVAARFAARGVPVVDADGLARTVVEPGTPALAEIVDRFGMQVIGPDGRLLRKQLAEFVFADSSARADLEAITHPRIRALARSKFTEFARQGEPLVCYEVPLLFEAGLDAELRPIVVVWAPESVRIARTRTRDGGSDADVRARIAAQLDLDEKVRRADYRIDNDGSLESTFAQADTVLRRICESQGIDPGRYGLA
jgi:dephospho-CoA kinase